MPVIAVNWKRAISLIHQAVNTRNSLLVTLSTNKLQNWFPMSIRIFGIIFELVP